LKEIQGKVIAARLNKKDEGYPFIAGMRVI
jgi:hypothetical protein